MLNVQNRHAPSCAIETDSGARTALGAIGLLMGYPEAGLVMQGRIVAEAIGPLFPEAAEALFEWARGFADSSEAELQESWTRSFDLAPHCTPYVSVHLFGKESFARARLMAGLAQEWRRGGNDFGTELPDHIGVILQGAPSLSDEVWFDVTELVLEPALALMVGKLEGPWGQLLVAAQAVLATRRRIIGPPMSTPDSHSVMGRAALPSSSPGEA